MSEFDHTLAHCSEAFAEVPEGWGQGRATFGGMVAALMYHAIEQRSSAPRPLRAVSVSFVAPLAPGRVDFDVVLLRAGKSSSQWQCTGLQQGKVVAVMLASQGEGRLSSISVEASPAPLIPALEGAQPLPYIPGVVPEFTRHFEFRWSLGELPFSSSSRAEIGGWVRLRDSRARASAPYLMALVDAWPPAVLPMFRAPAPISSLTWTIEFTADASQWCAGDWWQYQAVTEYAAEGYAHIAAQCRAPDGALVALSRQTVALFT